VGIAGVDKGCSAILNPRRQRAALPCKTGEGERKVGLEGMTGGARAAKREGGRGPGVLLAC
jgi:hypothetical protein